MYQGTLLDSGYSFSYTKPGLFPSIFLGQKFKGNQEIQLNYSRRVHRPNFWQISPRVDYSDPLNLRKGNPHLQPEYTNSFEFTYDKMWNQGTSFYATLYFRNTNNEITSYVTPISSDTLLSTFVNANTSNSYGAELTLRTPITSWWDVTLNGNFYQTDIKASNLAVGLSNSGFSWFGKLVSETRLPKHFTLQLYGRYEGPRVIPQGTVQGFGALDAAIRKEFLKNNAASLSLSFSDIFNSERRVEHTETPKVFIQDVNRKRLSQIIRLNFSYRFGKQDFSLFKRKAKSAQQGQDNSIMMNPEDQ
jgi:outer membrane receptor protein involved in Fe transport